MNDWRTILAIDHDAKACEVYRANIDAERVECGNVADFIDGMPYADVILGGPPCQPYSSAGKQQGDEDARDCVPDFCAAVERVRPRMFLMEEVDAFAEQAKFQPVLQRTVKRLRESGYDVDLRVLDAVNFGVPQFRRRAWLWGIRKDLGEVIARRKWPTPTHVWPHPDGPCMFGGSLLPAVTVGQALGLDAWRSEGNASSPRYGEVRSAQMPCCTLVGGSSSANTYGGIIGYRWSDAMREKHPPASPAPTVQAKWYKGGAEGLLSVDGRTWESRHPTPTPAEPMVTLRGRSPRDNGRCTESVINDGLKVRRLTPDECARLQSMPDDFIWPDSVKKTHRYRVIGNGWASLMANRMSEAFSAADPESRTVIDLFCGGGCGAVGWHGRAWERRACG